MTGVEGSVKAFASDRNYSLITAILFWSGLAVVSSLYITIPMVAVFTADFQLTTAQAAWSSSAFSSCYALGVLAFGPLSDRYGRKQIMLFGLGILAMVTPIIGLMHGFTWLVVLRAIQGAAAATFAPTAVAYVMEFYPVGKRVSAIGIVSSSFLMSGIAGQVFSSFMIAQFSWSSVFYTLGVVYFITAILTAFFLPANQTEHQAGGRHADSNQLKAIAVNYPLLCCYTIALMLLLSFVGMYTALGSYLSNEFHLSEQQILYVRSTGMIGMLLAPFAGRFVDRFGMLRVLRGGVLLAVFGLAVLGFTSSLALLVIVSVVFVSGISVTVPTLISLVGHLGGQARGLAVALYTFILFLGATLGPIIAVSLLKTGSYLLTFELLAILLGIGLASAFIIRLQKERKHQ